MLNEKKDVMFVWNTRDSGSTSDRSNIFRNKFIVFQYINIFLGCLIEHQIIKIACQFNS